MAGSVKLYSEADRQRELAAAQARYDAWSYGNSSDGRKNGNGNALRSAIEYLKKQPLEKPAGAAKPAATAPVASAAPPAAAPAQSAYQPAPVIADPVAALQPAQQSVPAAAAAILAQTPAPPTPTMNDATNRVDQTPPAQLDPQGTITKKKKLGVASTILTGEKGLASLGSTGTRMLLG